MLDDIMETEKEIIESCTLSVVLFIESIRKLIKNNATHYVFEETIKYRYE